ncbi:hypothetical protein FACS189426_02510 [Bacteroidia bacterium]|nr:hypothetical protein FACS189426_02510 [Bacteroidia bacterium]
MSIEILKEMDNNKHKMYLTQILTDIYSDRELSVNLGFKGLCTATHKPFLCIVNAYVKQ